MKYLVDREQMRDVIFNGHASLANDHPVAPFDQFFSPVIPQREFDPDRARHHLKKAGYGGETIRIHASAAAFSGAVDAGVLYAENARQAGFNLEVVREPVDGYWADVWGTAPFCYCYWNARPTPDLMLTLVYICDAAWADAYWCDREFTDLVVAARTELDTARRKLLYADVQLILHERGATIVPLFQNLVHGVRDRLDTGGGVLGAAPFDAFRMFRNGRSGKAWPDRGRDGSSPGLPGAPHGGARPLVRGPARWSGRRRGGVSHSSMGADLVEGDGGGTGHVETEVAARGGDAHQPIAGPGNETAQAAPLCAEDQCGGKRHRRLAQGQGRSGVETGNPESALLETIEGAGDVGDTHQKHPFEGPGGGAGEGRRRGRSMTILHDDRRRAEGCGRSHDGAGVAGIADAVEDHDEVGRSGNVVEGEVRQRMNEESRSLVAGVSLEERGDRR